MNVNQNRLEKSKKNISLVISLSMVVMALLLVTMLIVGVIGFFFIYRGMLKLDASDISATQLFFIFIALCLFFGTILSFITVHFPLKPVTKIMDATNRTDSFNTMAEELGQIEMLRTDFINNFSHEFKTPIVSIAGFTKLLKKGNLPEETRNEYLEIIEEESLRLAALATNVLDLAKVENQSILSDTADYNLSEQLRNCVLLLESKWSKKNIEPVLPEEECQVHGNEELLKQVWINLLDNAIKFSEDYSTIEIRIEEEEENLRVMISNFGEPIPEDKRKRIFGKFYQADESHATQGNGVGLAIVKKITELHKGSVDVECRDGQNIFIVSLPKYESV